MRALFLACRELLSHCVLSGRERERKREMERNEEGKERGTEGGEKDRVYSFFLFL